MPLTLPQMIKTLIIILQISNVYCGKPLLNKVGVKV